ncbi:MAG: Rieske (2Fe-2S) protein [Ktedonobacterales bacterium]
MNDSDTLGEANTLRNAANTDSNATQGMATGGAPDTGEYTRPSDATSPAQDEDTSRERRTIFSRRRLANRQLGQQWQEEFPYHWNADDLVTRRDTLRFLVAGSGALWLASVALAIAGAIRSPTDRHMQAIARVGEVPVNGSKVFTYPNSYAQGILVNLPGKGLVAYSDVCTHLSCAVLYQSSERRFYCPCHDGLFDATTGEVLGGPPTRPLPLIRLQVRGGIVYAMEEVER